MDNKEFEDLKIKIMKAWEEYQRLQREYSKETGTELKWFK